MTLAPPGQGKHCTGHKSIDTRCMIENFQITGSILNEMFTSDVEIKKILCHCERTSGKSKTETIVKHDTYFLRVKVNLLESLITAVAYLVVKCGPLLA